MSLSNAMPRMGMPKTELMSRLASFRDRDLPWKSGRVLAYTYVPEDDAYAVAKEAYMMYLTENALDPTTFPSTHRLETETVRILRDLVQGDNNVVGNCTSGGTESILCAVKSAREWARKNRPEILEPEIVLPRTAHPAFHKAALYFGLRAIITTFDRQTFQADVDAMRNAITKNTILLVASAPGYAQGVVDPIPEIAALAQERGLLFHVDACVGGILLSFMRRMGGYSFPAFDFSVPGVTSLSLDMHKFGYAPKNISTVLYRSKELRRHQIFACRRTTTYALINPTVLSSKSGAPIAGAWAMLHWLGEEGYRSIVRTSMDATRRLVDGINGIDGLRVLGTPDYCMFSFTSDAFNIFELADEMRARGWYVQPQFSTELSPANLHITVTVATAPHVNAFLADLSAVAKELCVAETRIDPKLVREQVRALLEGLGENARRELAGLAGIEGTDIPQNMALINTVMDALPDELAEDFLADFMNDLYV